MGTHEHDQTEGEQEAMEAAEELEMEPEAGGERAFLGGTGEGRSALAMGQLVAERSLGHSLSERSAVGMGQLVADRSMGHSMAERSAVGMGQSISSHGQSTINGQEN